ncbi:MAG: histidinol dehydrogenase, partial [Bryobacteraceae bacterium]
MIRRIPAKDARQILERRTARLDAAEAVVRPILEAVRRRGDRALVEYARRLDGLEGSSVRIDAGELARAADLLSPEFRAAVDVASRNIRRFARMQLPRESTRVSGGVRIGQIVRPLDTVGAYIPGGRYPLPSTLLM